MIPQQTWTHVWGSLLSRFQELAKQIRQCVPDLTFVATHSNNTTFPFRAYASYAAKDGPSIDVSVDCKLSGYILIISVDVAQENGLILSEGPNYEINLRIPSSDQEVVAAFKKIETYIEQQVGLICNALL
jgi:hypothetical protein